jgi:8-oxo-dGTP diphosphatase
MTAFLDENGRSFDDYKKPNLAVDAILMTVYRGRLSVVLHFDRDGKMSLPGTFVHEGETLVTAVNRGLAEKLELSPIESFRQLRVFDAPDRDPRGWVFSVAHYALVHEDLLSSVRPKQVIPIENARSYDLKFDHNDMLEQAVTRLREEYSESPDPWDVLGQFTLSQLRMFHEAIDPSTYLRDTFRRVMEPQLVEIPDAKPNTIGAGRPSRIWRIASPDERIMRKFADREKVQIKRSRLTPTSERQESSMRKPHPMKFMAAPPLDSFALEPSFSQRAGDPSSPAEFSVEFEWSNMPSIVHDHLREREAFKLFDSFVTEVRETVSSVEPSKNRPISAIMRDENGSVVRAEKF